MRRVHTVTGAGVAVTAVLLAAGCSHRPNNLRDLYGFDPTGSSRASQGATPATSRAPVDPAPSLAERVSRALLDADDLAGEGVSSVRRPAPARVEALPGCAVDLSDDGRPPVASQAGWRYPSGSTLSEYVLGYTTARPAALVAAARAKIDCPAFVTDGAEHRMSGPFELAPSGADAQLAWCRHGPASFDCTALLGWSDLLGVVTVSAAAQQRAVDALQRVVPAAVAALRRG